MYLSAGAHGGQRSQVPLELKSQVVDLGAGNQTWFPYPLAHLPSGHFLYMCLASSMAILMDLSNTSLSCDLSRWIPNTLLLLLVVSGFLWPFFSLLSSVMLVKPASAPTHGEYSFYIIFLNSYWCILHLEVEASVDHS